MMMMLFKMFFICKLVRRGATLVFVSVYLIYLWVRCKRRRIKLSARKAVPNESHQLKG